LGGTKPIEMPIRNRTDRQSCPGQKTLFAFAGHWSFVDAESPASAGGPEETRGATPLYET
jgi:hypothetical protein